MEKKKQNFKNNCQKRIKKFFLSWKLSQVIVVSVLWLCMGDKIEFEKKVDPPVGAPTGGLGRNVGKGQGCLNTGAVRSGNGFGKIISRRRWGKSDKIMWIIAKCRECFKQLDCKRPGKQQVISVQALLMLLPKGTRWKTSKDLRR